MNASTLENYRFHRSRGDVASSAINLARAEETANGLEESGLLRFTWEHDGCPDLSWDDSGWFQRRVEDGSGSVLVLFLQTRCGECEQWRTVDSLGGITMLVDTEHLDRRSFEAQMALENEAAP